MGGPADGEANFLLVKQDENNTYIFEYRIALNIDDIDRLHFINNILGLGKIIKYKSRVICYYSM